MIKTISAFITACFMVISSFGVAADEKAPVSDKDREMREQVPAKLDGGQDKKQQKWMINTATKLAPPLKKIVKSGARKYPSAPGMDKG